MHIAQRVTSIAAVTALLLTATLSSARAATCELSLKSFYECSGTYSDGSSGNYCIWTRAFPATAGSRSTRWAY